MQQGAPWVLRDRSIGASADFTLTCGWSTGAVVLRSWYSFETSGGSNEAVVCRSWYSLFGGFKGTPKGKPPFWGRPT